MGRIWFDVTSILGWHRPAVGVIRVEAECARYALDKLSTSVRFCRFDHVNGYIDVGNEDVRRAVERIADGRPTPRHKTNFDGQTDVLEAASAWSTRERLAVFGRRFVGLLPHRFRDPMRRLLIATFELGLEVAKTVRTLGSALLPNPGRIATNSAPEQKSSVERMIPFERDDVYISLGLDWDQKDAMFIAEQKLLIGFKTLLCCYDIIPVKFPHLSVGDVAAKFAHYFVDIAWYADELVSISECSKQDLILLLSTLGAPTPETTVIRLGTELPARADDLVSEETKKAATERFILFVSTIERRKNHETIYRAITRLVDKGCTEIPKVVFVGMQGWGVADLMSDLRFDLRVRNRISILNHVSDADLAWLYRNALFTVFPSLYEGWGLAVGESLAAGKFCLCSNVASLPEVGKEWVEYIDPWDVPAWAERLEYYFTHPAELKRREAHIREHHIPPKWSDTASIVFSRAMGLLAASSQSGLTLPPKNAAGAVDPVLQDQP